MKLHEIAHSRAGDKGNVSTISVIAYHPQDYGRLLEAVTEDRVMEQFQSVGAANVKRYELPSLAALNFVLSGTLGGGVTCSLALDTHGKSLSALMLEMDI